MITFLSKKLIKNYSDYSNGKVRVAYGILCGAVGIFLNVVLFGIKLLAGMLSNSIAIIADAFNNLSDAGSSVISMLGFKLAGQKPDPQHPFGHGRIEYLSGLLVSVVIILMGFELFEQAIDKIRHPENVEFNAVVTVILVVSVAVKLYMAFYNYSVAKKIDSDAMKATFKDSLSDSIATLVVLISQVIGHFSGLTVDGYTGLAVAAFVFWAGISSIKDTVSPLLGTPPEPEFVEKLESIVLSEEHRNLGILGMHDLIVHDYGPGRVMVTLHAEVPSDGNIMELHDLIDNIEDDLRRELECHATIHMDPVCVGDPETDELKELVKEAVDELNLKVPNSMVTFHDFRLVKGPTHTNLIFDVVLPYKYSLTDEETTEFIGRFVSERRNNVFCAINVDKAYVKDSNK